MKHIIKIKSETASGNRKGWVKAVSGVKMGAQGGWAIEGDFLPDGEVALESGTVLADCYPIGSVRHGSKGIRFGVVSDEGTISWTEGHDDCFDLYKEGESMKRYLQELLHQTGVFEDRVAELKHALWAIKIGHVTAQESWEKFNSFPGFETTKETKVIVLQELLIQELESRLS